MSEFTTAQLVWNRACSTYSESQFAGDLALESMLFVHNLLMNGGVFHAVGSIEAELVADAEAGYRDFGFDGAAALLNEARSIFETGDTPPSLDYELGDRYSALIPEDSRLFDRFEDYFQRNPSEFAPP